MNDAPATAPLRLVDGAEVRRRLAMCEGVGRVGGDDDDLRRFVDRVGALPSSTRIEGGRSVRIGTTSGPVATIHLQIDDARTWTPVLDLKGIISIVEHAIATQATMPDDLDALLAARAFAGDADGRRTASLTIGMAAGTPWSDPVVAGHGPGWHEAPDPLRDAADLPYIHTVRLRGDGLTLEQRVILDSPCRLKMDPITTMRILALATSRNRQRASAGERR